MSRKQYTPYLLIALVLLLFVLAEFLIPKPLNWTISLSAKDKNPYGAYGLKEVLPDLFPGQDLQNVHLTIYETDSLPDKINFLILAQNFAPDQQDTRVLLEKVSKGAKVLMAASSFGGPLADSLNLHTQNLLFETLTGPQSQLERDSAFIRFQHPAFRKSRFAYTLAAAPNYFDSLPAASRVLALNHQNKPVLIGHSWGKGEIFVSSTPLAFTNYYLLEGNNHHFIEAALSLLPVGPLLWTEYYQLGRMEAQTPLRFILSNRALRWAYYFGMSILLLFILFSLKRRQRPIPAMQPPENTSLQFAASIGNLYFQQGNHQHIARKKIIYLSEYIRTHYRLDAAWHDPDFPGRLAQKSNKPLEEVQDLNDQVQQAETAREYSAAELLRLHKSIRAFEA